MRALRDASIRSGSVWDESSIRQGSIYQRAGGSIKPESLLLSPNAIKLNGLNGSLHGAHHVRRKSARAIPDSESARQELWAAYRRLNPSGRFVAAWQLVVAFWVAWAFVALPVRLAFGDAGFWRAIDVVGDACFAADLLVLAYTAHAENGRLVLARWPNLRHQLSGWAGAGRLLALVPVALLVPELVVYPPSANPFLFVRLVRLARAREVARAAAALDALAWLPVSAALLARHLGLLFYQAHWTACAWFAIGRYAVGDGSGASWITETAPGLLGAPAAAQYLASLYFALGSLLTVGYGELHAVDWREQLFLAATFLANVALLGRALADLAAASVWAWQHAGAFRVRMRQLQELMEEERFPATLRTRLGMHFAVAGAASAAANDMLEALPYSMRCEIADHRTRSLAEQCALLQGCDGRFVQALAVIMRRAVFTPGQYITRVEDPSREMYIIGSGEVEIWNEDLMHARRVIGRGQSFGEFAALFAVKQTHTAFTRSQCVLYAIRRDPFEELAHNFLEQVGKMRQNAMRMGGTSLGRAFDSVKASIRRLEEEQLMRLCYFAGFNDVENMTRMLDSGLDVNAADYDGRTALHISASEGHVKATELLLRRGADPGRRDRWGGTPMQNAVKFGHDSVAAILRQHGARLTDDDVGDALYVAASEGDIETLQRYIRNGANANLCDYDKRSALHLAASEGQLAAVEILLKMGADIDARDRFGCAPLDDALRGGYEDVANLLREKVIAGSTLKGGSVVSGAWGPSHPASSRAGSTVRRRSDAGSDAASDDGRSAPPSPRAAGPARPDDGLGKIAEEEAAGASRASHGASVRSFYANTSRTAPPAGMAALGAQAEEGAGRAREGPSRSFIMRGIHEAANAHLEGHGGGASKSARLAVHSSIAELLVTDQSGLTAPPPPSPPPPPPGPASTVGGSTERGGLASIGSRLGFVDTVSELGFQLHAAVLPPAPVSAPLPAPSAPAPAPAPAARPALAPPSASFGSFSGARANGPGPALSLPLTRDSVARLSGEGWSGEAALRRRGGRFTRVLRADGGETESQFAPSEAGGGGFMAAAASEAGSRAANRKTVVICPDDALQRFLHYVGVREGIRAHRIRFVFGGADLVVLSNHAPVVEGDEDGSRSARGGVRSPPPPEPGPEPKLPLPATPHEDA